MELGKVDLRGLEPGAPGWDEAGAAVAASMLAHGCVVVVAGGLAPALREALFGRVLPELFALPHDVKLRNAPGVPPHTGYFCRGVQESVRIDRADDVAAVHPFADLLWPDRGNPLFCEAVSAAARELQRLESAVVRMVLESLGLPEKVAASPHAHEKHVRLFHYAAQPNATATGGGLSVAAHYDYALTAALMQHDVEGLEVQARDGRWIAVPPNRDTYAVIAGELFTVLTNGRVPACLHRADVPVVRPLDGLVDAAHPRLYRPVDYEAYARFKYSDEGLKLGNGTLDAFCRVKEGGEEEEPQTTTTAG
ncbi:hypothetical protein EJB05_49225, partial [Eragrostis curvula]